jgi:uncharacterized protein (TIGR03067 family)
MFANCLRVLLIGGSLLLLGFAPAPFPKPDRNRGDDQTDVGGTWAFELYENSGRPDDYSKKEYVIEMTKEQFVFVTKGNSRTVYVMRLDPTASPPSFTWSMNNTVMFVGSYRVQKNQVSMIFKYANNVAMRPTDFGSKPEYHYVLRRIRR